MQDRQLQPGALGNTRINTQPYQEWLAQRVSDSSCFSNFMDHNPKSRSLEGHKEDGKEGQSVWEAEDQ